MLYNYTQDKKKQTNNKKQLQKTNKQTKNTNKKDYKKLFIFPVTF